MDVKALINSILSEAYQNRSADVYIVPRTTKYLIERHHHNQVITMQALDCITGLKLINYLKYNGNMLISEHRRPQIGAMEWQHQNARCYLRFSTVGDFKGREAMVIRLIYPLNEQTTQFFFEHQFRDLKQRASQRGLMVFAGPTGSGKTTTIYHLARQYSQNQMIMTIEDPVEVYEPSFLQLQVNADAEMSYQELLKVGLRNRPDIFIIGEIRDANTAQAAVQAALSGHLVLTTIHSKTPLGVVQRLMNLGVERDYLEQALNTVVYQRLLNTSSGQPKALLNTVTSEAIFEKLIDGHQSIQAWRNDLQTLITKGQLSTTEGKRVWYG
ncbi:Flp pilus assembly complex ATPase component TadA [Nicoliella spurrieriana]|uniref:Flp pilus assembly complex ATPase component TadA n=1 Tax=Nicoliella spurrieriana TaxID=2925830 RepID=A0A976X586_9LACO|nr:competence type IV pilus ATPase ComGA [Nicoliella spurrieriana]UQS86773.1 Flp pilus assembly complex ATPase component TadA [Nicoliella spurrieriana]